MTSANRTDQHLPASFQLLKNSVCIVFVNFVCMNIVKGVADLIRRSSIGQNAKSTSGLQVEHFSLPTHKIHFSEVGSESVLNSLWQRYENAVDKVERRRLFHVFLEQFLDVYNKWEPADSGKDPETISSTVGTVEHASQFVDVIGCSAGHPTEFLLALAEEVAHLTSLVTEYAINNTESTSGSPWASASLTVTAEGVPVLDALRIIVRSVHNCRVFGYFGGVQKLIALIKVAVVQLKTISWSLSAEESSLNLNAEKIELLQKLLLHVVSVICSFIDLDSNAYEMAQMFSELPFSIPKNGSSVIDSCINCLCETMLPWKQKVVVSVIEAGGLNWLVELMRVVRRLSVKEQWTNLPLQYLTLRALCSALSENPRAQNHFRTIGGLEVLLDGFGFPLSNELTSLSYAFYITDTERHKKHLLGAFHIHVFCMEVLREAVFGNLNNLQFLCENGRVHKFANSFCSPVFMLQEYKQWDAELLQQGIFQMPLSRSEYHNTAKLWSTVPFDMIGMDSCFVEYWKNFAVTLSRVLCSFILAPEELKSSVVEGSTGRNGIPISTIYSELSIKWFLRVLFILFPCIKACSYQDELPTHLRTLVYIVQRHVLTAFRTMLNSSPMLLDAFRKEGIWELVFSENLFYFEPTPRELPEDGEVENVHMEVISLVEFAATSTGNLYNLPECSALLDALEQSACNPEIATVLAKSLLRILQHSMYSTVSSFKELNAVSLVLIVARNQAQELRRSRDVKAITESHHEEFIPVEKHQRSNMSETSSFWHKSVEASVQLFSACLSAAADVKSLVLHDSTCIECLFDLFWEKNLRDRMLGYILDLMKTGPSLEEDGKAILQLCSKYLETFTQVKEKEKEFLDTSIDLLSGMRDMLLMDQVYYQDLFQKGGCFLHIVSLLNGTDDVLNGEKLALSVLQTLKDLLSSNDSSKAVFRALVGKGYQTLQSLLLDYCSGQPSQGLLNALLDMLVDGKFDVKSCPLIKNEDAVILYLSILQKSSDSLRLDGLDSFLQLLQDSISSRDSCVRGGMLNFLLDWFSLEDDDNVLMKIAQLIQVVGGHSIAGKDIRKIFALLRREKVGNRQQYCSLLLSSILSMLNEKGPTAFFDLIGNESGVIIRTPVQWPVNKGFTFFCWLRVENFPSCGTMGLFNFLTENGRGCFALLAKDKVIYESINQTRQCASLHAKLVRKKWHFLCITHSIGRAFSGGSLLKCYVDGELVSSEKCRYAKVNESLTNCTIGTKITLPLCEEDIGSYSIQEISPLHGQIGPVYLFGDAITPEQVRGIYFLGPSYMYSFLDNEVAFSSDNLLPPGILDAKDGLASKIIFGLNAKASNGKALYNVSHLVENAPNRSSFEANVMADTQLCSRRLLQQIIYCVGGVFVFFPLFSKSHWYRSGERTDDEHTWLIPITKGCLTAEAIEIIACVLDENIANQQQMHLISGFSILGFLLKSVPPQQLNFETVSALKHLFNVIANCGLSEVLMKDAISYIFLDPLLWVYTVYEVQRDLYMFLIQQFDNDPRLLQSLCRLPRVLDIIREYYWDNAKYQSSIGGKAPLNFLAEKVNEERPIKEIRKIRLLLLSLGEMSLRQSIVASDIKALIVFFETSNDVTSIEDVLHMIIRVISQKPLRASFVEQVNNIGGCHVFINLLKREYEPIRLLSLQFLGSIMASLPSEKKGTKFFNLAVGTSRSLSECNRKASSRTQTMFSSISDRIFRFPLTEHLCATLFDVLLGGSSPKQVLQKQSQLERQRSKGKDSYFYLPQIVVLVFKFLSECKNAGTRIKIIADLLDLLDSNPSNIEALMEYGWNAWLTASTELDVVKNYRLESAALDDSEINEQNNVRNLFSVVLSHYMLFVKGGWQIVVETTSFILMRFEQGGVSFHYLLRDIYKGLIRRLVDLSIEKNIFISQPCRDNTFYLLQLVDELLLSEIDHKLPFPASCSNLSQNCQELECFNDLSSALNEALQGEPDERVSSNLSACKQPTTNGDVIMDEEWWHLYDYLWIVISEMTRKGSRKMLPKSASSSGPSLGQRARDLVESLNIPTAEMAAAVVSSGIGIALGGKSIKNIDNAMLLRGEKCPRIVFRLVVLYLCRASLERASRCVQKVIPLMPSLLISDDEQSKNRLQLFIWSLLAVRSRYGMLDDGTRFHVMSHLIRETVHCGKSLLVTSIVGRDDLTDAGNNEKETGAVHNLIQKDKILTAVSDEVKYMTTLKTARTKQLHDFRTSTEESFCMERSHKQALEDDVLSSLNAIVASDNSRRSAFQLSYDEEQQVVAERWVNVFRSLIDGRGPWSAITFPNCSVTHWKLDKTEDSWRRRPKLRQNYHFDEKLCHPPTNTSNNGAVLSADESKYGCGVLIPEQIKRFLPKGTQRITDEGSIDTCENDTEPSGPQALNTEMSDCQLPELLKDPGFPKDSDQEKTDTCPADEGSKVLVSIPCVLVRPKRKLAGKLVVRNNVMHFFGEFLVVGAAGSSVFKNFDSLSNHESGNLDESTGLCKSEYLKLPLNLSPKSEKQNATGEVDEKSKNIKRHRRWSVSKIKAVHWTRYLLRYTAIEIFFSNSVAPIFINFASQKVAKDVGSLIVTIRNDFLFPKGSSRDRSGVISFIDRHEAQRMAETARESWRRREITNFEYLMILNTLSGRSYNDLSQYPVFPWILADYSTETLDLNKSSTFRDLSKPVGALDSKRFEVFEDRFQNFLDPDIPRFYYGSHYSSMGIVLYYLIRLEPFTALHYNLQGGKFDHADRLFQSIEGTYQNCLSNTSDVKELIPEFFYMPEFLVNSNSYHLGVKQDGERIGDVSLPAWAKGSPEEFINRNREALESEYVSSNLHHWIDLIFGYKQRGRPAIEAANIFYYLTYEGSVDLDSMEDEMQRSAIEDQIANFGQTPIQIFHKKHPRRGPPIPIAHPLRFAPGSICLTSIVSCTSNPPSALLYIGVYDSNVVLVNQGRTMSVKMWLTTQLQSGGNFTFSGSQVISLSNGRVVQSIHQHKDVVSAVAVTSDGSILATGSHDTTVMVWDVYQGKAHEKRVRNSQSEFPQKDYVISQTPSHILCGHDDIITCLYVSVELDSVISGSKDGTCVFHTLREGRYVRSLCHPSGSPLSKLLVSRHGWIVMYADDDLSLHLYSINGKHIRSSESVGRLNCAELSACSEFLVCAGDQGQIVLHSMNSLDIVWKYTGIGKIVTSLTVTNEECFLAGTKDGSLLVYSIENPRLQKESLPLNRKSKFSSAG
ncbi:hypothetical protein Nepgr_015875 [Nepenthes gracilis]|uniref:BEACH domain-containing protein B n=1 Tax=Nepenthes gracilis TaxID=150966 RepID=A0AAD3SNQ8_NEPGR|nr:hypothetical protein Nepgr_015875 [Nepenthes gracilis]